MLRKVIHSGALAILGALITLTISTSLAQPVGVSLSDGVHVRAPYVAVDVFPRGGVSVRAPFTAVDVGGRRYYDGRPAVVLERPIGSASYPTPQELAAMNDETLWRTLQSTSARLHDRLNGFDTGDTWRRYLRLPDQAATGPNAGEPGQREALVHVLQQFRDISADRRYQRIASLPAFAATQAGLAELVSRQRDGAALRGAKSEELPPPQRGRLTGERTILNEKPK